MHIRTLCACFCALAVLSTGLPAAEKSTSAATSTRRLRAPKAPVKLDHGESRKERDQRLLRECRGKPNAGACEGYAN